MLVKHNISTSYKIDKSNLFVWENGVDLNFDADTIIINRLRLYGIAYHSIRTDIDTDSKTIIKFIFENISGSSVYIHPRGLNENTGGLTSNKKEKREFEVVGLKSDGNLQLQIRPNSDEECRLKIYGIRVSTGDEASDVYLPNINTLPQDKQPLLPPEGNYKEIQAL